MFNLRRSQFVQVNNCFNFFCYYCFFFCFMRNGAVFERMCLCFGAIFPFIWLWQVFNNSPDETAYFRMLLNRENISNAAVMIQPSLISYSFNSLPQPALLDVASIGADRILLLDSYFSVVLFHGMTIAQWRNMGYQNQLEHQVCAHFLHAILVGIWIWDACRAIWSIFPKMACRPHVRYLNTGRCYMPVCFLIPYSCGLRFFNILKFMGEKFETINSFNIPF